MRSFDLILLVLSTSGLVSGLIFGILKIVIEIVKLADKKNE